MDEVQEFDLGGATTGTFQLNGNSTFVVFTVGVDDLQAAMDTLWGADNTVVSGSTITFAESFAGTDVDELTISDNQTDGDPYFSTSTEGAALIGGQPEIFTLALSDGPTEGQFVLTVNGTDSTDPLDYDISAVDLEYALNGLLVGYTVSVTGSAGGPWTVTTDDNRVGDTWSGESDSGDPLLKAVGVELATTQAYSFGRTTTYAYDNLGRLTTVTQPDPDGAGSLTAPETSYFYDANSRLTKVTDPLANDTDYVYDTIGRRISVTDALSGETSFTYDAAGRLLTLTDPVDNTTAWTYDNLGRQITETNELDATRSFSYDVIGNLISKTDRLGRVTEYVYDNLYRNTEELWKDGGTTVRTLSFEYNAAGELTMLSDPAAAYSYTRDALGRITSEGQAISGLTPAITFARTYNAAGLVTQLSTTLGSNADFQNDYSYDALLRLTQLTQHGQSGGNAVAEKRADFTYNSASQFASITRYADLAGSDLVVTSAYSYDGLGRLTGLDHAQGTTALAGYAYTFDAASRIASVDSLIDGLTDYDYDDTDQLTGADHTSQTDETYTYDANGNRTLSGYSVGDNNQLLSDGTYNYTYDAEGNRLTRTNIATGYVTEYGWDYRNRLTSVTEKDDQDNALSTVEQSYDV